MYVPCFFRVISDELVKKRSIFAGLMILLKQKVFSVLFPNQKWHLNMDRLFF